MSYYTGQFENAEQALVVAQDEFSEGMVISDRGLLGKLGINIAQGIVVCGVVLDRRDLVPLKEVTDITEYIHRLHYPENPIADVTLTYRPLSEQPDGDDSVIDCTLFP